MNDPFFFSFGVRSTIIGVLFGQLLFEPLVGTAFDWVRAEVISK